MNRQSREMLAMSFDIVAKLGAVGATLDRRRFALEAIRDDPDMTLAAARRLATHALSDAASHRPPPGRGPEEEE